ncbi:MAG: twin-arginine translocase subunit TatC [Myxococcales bacterium]
MEDADSKLTLLEHLTELRTRLWRVTLAVLVLGGASLVWARELFNLMMRPVLDALPEESRSLVYTSGIEELNVLLKVGMYAGLFMATPVALYQLWKFVAPGLLKNERQAIAPFVVFGTLFFVGGAAFCYFAILPSMFKFLLTPGEAGPVRERIVKAKTVADDAARMLFAGDPGRAADMARAAVVALGSGGDGKVDPPPVLTHSHVELADRSARLGRLLDGTVAHELDYERRKAVTRAIGQHQEADALLANASEYQAAAKLEESAESLAASFGADAASVKQVWDAHRHLAAAAAKLGAEEWTRPMLSMKEQLSLVLMLELAFGAIFELPLVMALLAMIGLLKFRFVARYQRHAIVLCVLVAALITPTSDAVNLSLMAVPMIVCFELGVILVWIFEKRRNARDAADGDTTSPMAG